VVEGSGLDDIYPYINPVALFRVQWQFRKGKRTTDEYERELEDKAEPDPRSAQGPVPGRGAAQAGRGVRVLPGVQSDGDDLVVFDAEDQDREIERFSFPRQGKNRRLCISDFFRDADECREIGRKDVLGLSCVTMGQKISEVCKTLFEATTTSEYLYMHGMGVETAEALAELWHKRMRQELGIAGDDSPKISDLFAQKYRGSRYSFGYPACPEMSDQDKLWRLIDPSGSGASSRRTGRSIPEQSTSAIVVHHPEAKYFNA
jgi:5-methyltetrahydrofolate--homocysteine methyltransferase